MPRGHKKGMFHHSTETKDKLRQLALGVVRSEEYRKKMSEATKKHWSSPEGLLRRQHYKETLSGEGHHMYGKKHNDESKEKMRQRKLGGKLSDEHKRKIGLASKSHGISVETRKKMGKSLSVTRKAQWETPDYVLKQAKARLLQPNKSEMVLDSILAESFPQFKYNGDGRLKVVVAGLIPDYVDVIGQKKLIELFGELYHDPIVAGRANRVLRPNKTEGGRLVAFKREGWDCLIIWGKELRNPTKIREKIAEFVKEGKDEND